MPWGPMAAQVGLGALQSFFGGRAESYYARGNQYAQQAQALANRAAETQQLTQQMQLQGRQNEAIAKADIQTLINTNMQAALLGINLSAQKRAAAQNRVAVKRNSAAAVGEAMTDAAAAGTIGSSVQAVTNDIRRQSADANAAIADQRDADSFNYQVSVEQLYRGYQQGEPAYDSSIPQSLPPLIMGRIAPKPQGFGSALLGSAFNVGAEYLTARMSLGMGKQSSSAPVVGVGQPVMSTVNARYGLT